MMIQNLIIRKQGILSNERGINFLPFDVDIPLFDLATGINISTRACDAHAS